MNKPKYILFRVHNRSNIKDVHPIIAVYNTEEDYKIAINYNFKYRSKDALFSSYEVINPGIFSPEEVELILLNIQSGEYNGSIPEPKRSLDLHTH